MVPGQMADPSKCTIELKESLQRFPILGEVYSWSIGGVGKSGSPSESQFSYQFCQFSCSDAGLVGFLKKKKKKL